MKIPTLLTCLTLLSAAAPAPQSGGLTWDPAPGTRLQRTFVSKHTLAAERMEQSVNGESALSQRLFDLNTRNKLVVTDELLEREGGRPTRFRRAYEQSQFRAETVRSLGRQQTKDASFQGEGSVAGTGVVFTWVPEDEVYGRYFDVQEGVEEVLPKLEADLSLRQLLPPTPVEVGASWKLPPGVLRYLFTTGGDTDYQLDADKGMTLLRTMRLGIGMNLEQAFGEAEVGEVEARWLGVEEVDGRRLALIDLSFDVELSRDLRERAAAGMSMAELSTGFYVESALVKVALAGGGRLRWDVAGGHLHDTQDLKATERVTLLITQQREGEEGAEPETNVQHLVMAGVLTQEITCARVD